MTYGTAWALAWEWFSFALVFPFFSTTSSMFLEGFAIFIVGFVPYAALVAWFLQVTRKTRSPAVPLTAKIR